MGQGNNLGIKHDHHWLHTRDRCSQWTEIDGRGGVAGLPEFRAGERRGTPTNRQDTLA